jgi:hypothetical protein
MPFIPGDYGRVGDYYIDKDTGDFYGPKTEFGWPDTPFFTALVDATHFNRRYIHNQPTPATVWNITHSLQGKPSVTIVDSAGTAVIGEVQYISETQISVTFTAAFSGQALLT